MDPKIYLRIDLPKSEQNSKNPYVNVAFSQLNELTGMLGKFKYNMNTTSPTPTKK